MPRPNERIGPYELIRKLGKGAFGEVWLAHDVDNLVVTANAVALKLPLDDEVDLDAIRQEATVWVAASGHPNVLPMLEARVYAGQVIIASEYAPDGSLQQWLKANGGQAPSVEAALAMTRGILDGLAHLHGRRIIHRDLKPDNILLKGTTPRLADFGLSRVFKSTTMSVQAKGTPIYMAPEAFKGKRTPQTDLWSVGVILYQLLSGRFPFVSNDKFELYARIINDEPAPLPAQVPGWLQQVVLKALSKNPAERFQTAEAFRAALDGPPELAATTVRVTLSPEQAQTVIDPLKTNTAPPVPAPLPPTQPAPPPRKVEPAPPITLSTLPAPAPRPSRWPWLVGLLGLPLLSWAIYLASSQKPSITPSGVTVQQSQVPTSQQDFTETINGVKLEMKAVPAGSFLMGSPDNEPERYGDEGPQHRVNVPAFAIGKYEITQAQWQAVMGNNPANFKGDNLPVEQVSWNDAKEFCRKLSQLTGKPYRLPSEAEWEYAARARTTGPYAGELDAMAWYDKNSGGKTHPVGQKQANAFGLFDMHGNVWEWCEDVWHDSYGGQHGNPPADGSAWLSGGDSSRRVLRGGSWGNYGRLCRSAYRFLDAPGNRDNNNGFRVVVGSRTL